MAASRQTLGIGTILGLLFWGSCAYCMWCSPSHPPESQSPGGHTTKNPLDEKLIVPLILPDRAPNASEILGNTRVAVRRLLGKPEDSDAQGDEWMLGDENGGQVGVNVDYYRGRAIGISLTGVLASEHPNNLGLHADEVCNWVGIHNASCPSGSLDHAGTAEFPAFKPPDIVSRITIGGCEHTIQVSTLGSLEVYNSSFEDEVSATKFEFTPRSEKICWPRR